MIGEKNILGELWNLAITLIEFISKVFDWLFEPLKINIDIIKIPYLLPDGFTVNFGIAPIALLGVGLVGLVIYWIVWA